MVPRLERFSPCNSRETSHNHGDSTNWEVPMFFRTKSSGPRTYLQVVENRWEGGRSRQRVVATLGRLDQLRDSGQLDALLISGARLAHSVMILSAHAQGRLPVIRTQRIGPALIFERLWQQTGCQRVIQQILADRRFEFDVERAIFLTVLHRLFVSGSDRAADKWRRYYRIEGCDSLRLHHLYRAMAWLGQELPKDQQKDATPLAPRCTKDPDRGGALRASTRPLQRAKTGLLRHHQHLLRGPRGREPGAAGLQQGPPARPAADDRRGRAGRAGPADLLRALARQHDRRDDADPRGRSPPSPLRDRPDLHRGRSGHDQQGDDRGVGAGPPGVAVHPGGPDAGPERGPGRGALPGRSVSGRASQVR